VAINFGLDGERWNEELILQRYELLWEAGLVPEAGPTEMRQAETAPMDSRHSMAAASAQPTTKGALAHTRGVDAGAAAGTLPGTPMAYDHRRILATGIARLRAKIKYRPVVFELMPESFTLLQLQRAVEALAGHLLHKQNFRRLIDQQDLVEETGEVTTGTGGRPAKLFRFRREVVAERSVSGTKLPLVRAV
jgi:hypothetical protein